MPSKSKYCRLCGKQNRFDADSVNHVLHFLITIFTCSLWLPLWLLMAMLGKPYYCCSCGKRG